ncbi:MAG TPA: ATP-binding protein [Gemmatimonadales bacterium]|nr:ATP-binding protein [Gemmatimonadales bacterium]
MPPALAATGLGLLIALSGWLVLRALGLSAWWLLLLPVVTAFIGLVIETRRLRRAHVELTRQRDDAAAQLDRRISELFSLRELSYVLSESLELEHIVDQVARYAARFLQAEGSIVVLGEPGGSMLEVVAAEGTLAGHRAAASTATGSLVATAIERGRIEVAQEVEARDVLVFGTIRAASAAVVPLRLHGARIGAIAVTERQGGPFTTEDLWLLSTVATNASVALANSRLFAIVEQGRREWETAFNALREGIAVISPGGAIQRANSSLARLAGLSEEELIGRNFRELLFGDTEAAAALIEAAHEGESPPPVVLRPEGRDRFLRLTIAPLESGDERPGSMVALVEDVTDQRSMEAQLFQNEKMAAIGQLVSGVAHELNNPLTSIAGLTELLLERDVGGDAPRQHLRIIHEQAGRAGRIVRNLLTFVRKGTTEQSPVDVNDVVERTTMLVRYEIRLREIELVANLHPLPAIVMGDPHELQQVLLNLLTNSVHALAELPPGRPRRITVETARIENRVILGVRDTGDGVPPELVANLFTPFFTTKPAGQGTGLGLSLSYGLIQAHGGTLAYEEGPDGGAEFTIDLPAAEMPPAGALAPKGERKRRILIVDDDPTAHRVVAALFAADRYRVESARNGAEGLAMAAAVDYDLVIADATLAAPSGRPFVQELRESDGRWAERLVTVGGRSEDRRVSKPFDLRRLRALAEEVFAGGSVSTPPPAPGATVRP